MMALRDEILAGGFDLAHRDDGAIAAALSVGRVRLEPRPIGIGTILNALGPVAGAALLDRLDAARASIPPLKWAWVLLEAGQLDVSLAATRGQIDALVDGGLISAGEAAALKALAEVPDPVSAQDVGRALEGYEA